MGKTYMLCEEDRLARKVGVTYAWRVGTVCTPGEYTTANLAVGQKSEYIESWP